MNSCSGKALARPRATASSWRGRVGVPARKRIGKIKKEEKEKNVFGNRKRD